MWSMPRSVLRFVAVILGLCAVGGFILGVRGAPERARLPGEAAGGGAPIQASDAQPLDDLVLTPSELAPEPKKEEEKPAEEAEQAPLAVEKAPEPAPPPKDSPFAALVKLTEPPPRRKRPRRRKPAAPRATAS